MGGLRVRERRGRRRSSAQIHKLKNLNKKLDSQHPYEIL